MLSITIRTVLRNIPLTFFVPLSLTTPVLFLDVADDIMDKSTTRRGQPCWYLVPDVQMDAVNDALILESFMRFLITNYVKDPTTKYHVLDLFADTCLKTQIGQMVDLLSQPQGKKGPEILHTFSSDLQRRIVKYKTAFYTFYLPMACGFSLAGERSDDVLNAIREICVEIGTKFQIQDDYLDCYGEPEKIGKIGTDIQDHKCTWLAAQVLEKGTPEQIKVLEENLGHEEEEKVAAVKKLYNDFGMPALYAKQEEESLNRINTLLEKNKDIVAPELFEDIIKRVHGRQK